MCMGALLYEQSTCSLWFKISVIIYMYISFICQMKVFFVKYIQMITLFKHRFFEVWKEWAQRKAQLRRDSQEFSNQRIQSWVKMDAIYFHDKNDVQLKLLVVYCYYNISNNCLICRLSKPGESASYKWRSLNKRSRLLRPKTCDSWYRAGITGQKVL